MRLKNLTLFISLLFFGLIQTFSQTTIVESEENDTKVYELALFIDGQINENNPEGFMSKFDTSHISESIKLIESNLENSEKYKKGFLIGIMEGLKGFSSKISSQIGMGAYYDFVNYRYDTESQTYFMLFRYFDTESGVNYHDYKVVQNNDTLMFNDIYVYLSGEFFSDTFSRVYKFSSNIFANESDINSTKLGKAFVDFRAGNYQNAYDILDVLTEDDELSKQKFLHVMKIQVAKMLGEDKYMDSIEDLKNNFEDDPTIYLTLIDYYIMKEDYSVAYDLLDNLQVETSDDFLNYIKGNLAFLKGDYAEAEQYFNYMIENYADFYLPYFMNVSALAFQQKYDETVVLFDSIIEVFDYDKNELIIFIESVEDDGSNELEGLVNSKAYKKWKKKS